MATFTDGRQATVQNFFNATEGQLVVPLSIGSTVEHSWAIAWGIIGFFGNVAIVTATFFRSSFSPHIMILLSLNLGDAIFCLMKFYRYMHNMRDLGWTGGGGTAISCWVDAVIVTPAHGIMVLSTVLLALERYFVIVKGVSEHGMKTKLAIAAIWVWVTVYTLIWGTQADNINVNEGGESCQPFFTSKKPLMMFLSYWVTIWFIIFYSIILFCYRQISAAIATKQQEGGKPLSNLEKRALNKLSLITVIHVLFTFPFVISLCINTFGGIPAPEWLVSLYSNLLLLNSAVNPVIFYFMDPLIKANMDAIFGFNRLCGGGEEEN